MLEGPDRAPLTTVDRWLGGRLTLRQPRKGHRVGSDAALLAAAAPKARRVADVGAGVGGVGLAIALRFLGARVDLIEIDPELSALALENAAANGLRARTRVVTADATLAKSRRAAGLKDGEADLVVTNPPFFEAARVRASSEAGRARAHVLPSDAAHQGAAAWIKGSLALLAPGGRFVMIHRPEALPLILDAFDGRLGAIAILPIHPRVEATAHRLLISGIKGARAPLRLLPALVLHDPSGGFTPRSEALHRGEMTIEWGQERSFERTPPPWFVLAGRDRLRRRQNFAGSRKVRALFGAVRAGSALACVNVAIAGHDCAPTPMGLSAALGALMTQVARPICRPIPTAFLLR